MCKFLIPKAGSPRKTALYIKELLKVSHDLAFLLPHWRRSFARPLLRSHDDEEQLSLDVDGTAAAKAPYLARQRCRGD